MGEVKRMKKNLVTSSGKGEGLCAWEGKEFGGGRKRDPVVEVP